MRNQPKVVGAAPWRVAGDVRVSSPRRIRGTIVARREKDLRPRIGACRGVCCSWRRSSPSPFVKGIDGFDALGLARTPDIDETSPD
jgi:hypothetical protein